MFDVGVVNLNISSHFSKFTNNKFGTAITGITNIFTIGRTQNEDTGSSHNFTLIPQTVANQARNMKRAGIINIDRQRGNFEDIVFKAHQSVIRPNA